MRSRFVVTVLVALAAARPAAAAPLTLDQALAMAAEISPDVRAERARVAAAAAAVDQARVARRPQLSAGASASVGGRIPDADTTSTRLGLDLQASWQITDFGRTSATIAAARLDHRAEEVTAAVTARDVRYAVTTAYLEVIARQKLVEVARTALAGEQRHLDEARRFVAAGTRDPIEAVQAETRQASAQAAVIRAEGNAATAVSNLWQAIGTPEVTRAAAVDAAWPTGFAIAAGDAADVGALTERAARGRAELTRDALAIDAAEARIDAARAGRRPTLALAASAESAVIDRELDDPAWSIGLTLSVPIYDGGATTAATRSARAGRDLAAANAAADHVAIAAEVNAGAIAVRTGKAALEAVEVAAVAAREQLRQAEARYQAGVGSAIELADAQDALTTAEGDVVEAEWTLIAAHAQLARAVGSL